MELGTCRTPSRFGFFGPTACAISTDYELRTHTHIAENYIHSNQRDDADAERNIHFRCST